MIIGYMYGFFEGFELGASGFPTPVILQPGTEVFL